MCALCDTCLEQSVPIYTFSQFGSILFLLNFGLDHDAGLLSTSSPAVPPTNRGGGGGDASLQGGARRTDAAFSQGGASIRLLMSRRAVFHVVSHGLVATSVLAGECVGVCVAPLAIRKVKLCVCVALHDIDKRLLDVACTPRGALFPAVVMVVLGLTSSWSEAILLASAYSISATSVKKLRQLHRAGTGHSHPAFQLHLVRMLTAQNVVMGLLLAVPYAVATGVTFLYVRQKKLIVTSRDSFAAKTRCCPHEAKRCQGFLSCGSFALWCCSLLVHLDAYCSVCFAL